MAAEVEVVVGSLDPWSTSRIGVRVVASLMVMWKFSGGGEMGAGLLTFIYGACVS
jgi:hypothetical protein